MVKPEGSELQFLIKKSQIAVRAADARPSRFVGGERIDAAIAELNIYKRKVSLSIKLLEEFKIKRLYLNLVQLLLEKSSIFIAFRSTR